MGDDGDLSHVSLVLGDFGAGEPLVDHAGAFPQDYVYVGLGGDPLAQILIRGEDHAFDPK